MLPWQSSMIEPAEKGFADFTGSAGPGGLDRRRAGRGLARRLAEDTFGRGDWTESSCPLTNATGIQTKKGSN